MKNLDFGRYLLGSLVVAAMLAACGGSQPPIGAPGTMPQGPEVATHTGRGGSWMLPEAKAGGLIYAAGGCGSVCVFSFPKAKLVGSLDVADPNGACSDSGGNVYIVGEPDVFEYAHGGTNPIRTLTLPPDAMAQSCAVDPTTGDVAVTGDLVYGDVAVFTPGSGSPTTYTVSDGAMWSGYDNEGNLFVDGYKPSSKSIPLSELAHGASQFISVSTSGLTARAGEVQWDGKYLTVEGADDDGSVLVYRLSVQGYTATLIGTTATTTHGERAALASWIEGNHILIPYGTHASRTNKLGVWNYPAGGKPIRKDFRGVDGRPAFQGVTYSVASK
ncbi:MAG TPA: hypothetical protein VFE16_01225 [Candidatus Cybelea sp.]|jgi:hypothetical protein|nr:hypothetical protein [Candidatus Cybelea sp.]